MNDRHADTSRSIANLDEFENRLQARLSGRVRNLRIVLHNGGLILRGLAGSYHAKQVAQHAIMIETRVPILANEIEVH